MTSTRSLTRWLGMVLGVAISVGTTVPAPAAARQENPTTVPGDAPGEEGETTPYAGYLFAHMLHRDYGRLYYSISRDGLHWTLLNNGQRIEPNYLGHPDITRGHDGRYYMIGVGREEPTAGVWASEDLVEWEWTRDLDPQMFDEPALDPDPPWHGAPKIFYDRATKQYLITWHASFKPKLPEKGENFWSGMRTWYVTSKDLTRFTEPKRLFEFEEPATIDVIVRREGDTYYAIIKDELYPSFDWPTGKTIRICTSENLTGPWSAPSDPVSPNFREAPAVIPRPDGRGWYMYYEQYPALSYDVSTAPSLAGPWHGVFAPKTSVPEGARHGCMIPLDQAAYDAVMAAYGPGGSKSSKPEAESAE